MLSFEVNSQLLRSTKRLVRCFTRGSRGRGTGELAGEGRMEFEDIQMGAIDII